MFLLNTVQADKKQIEDGNLGISPSHQESSIIFPEVLFSGNFVLHIYEKQVASYYNIYEEFVSGIG